MITQTDFAILDFIQSIRTDFLDKIVPFITHLGDGGMLWIVVAVIMLCFGAYRKTGIRIFVSLAISSVLFTLIMKELVARERPFNTPQGLLAANELLIEIPFGRYSFPSGHTLTSFASAFSIFLTNKKLGSIFLVIAALISLSRVYLYVHYPSDIIFGAIFGILSALAVKYVEDKLSARAGKRNRE
jgi:undecaprenyl-diphosphatase